MRDNDPTILVFGEAAFVFDLFLREVSVACGLTRSLSDWRDYLDIV